ncbi:MAG: tRNA lysidine(34) synthetase TilS [Bacteroidales bacterium]|jgi:tRNA(Ile)-lysidine synthase|nr:tRNA lysidine(34) synthetase TilS [Bacteroidales bacterium]MBQ2542291.1 tRNA lysidine(34) synthetase TilS [Bacteroidales bacterium]MBQ3991285.1 tRNA lysidine(34) synthetase TilS [Bacteroidales bacterium]MBQ5571660.1 tRNA lysidine(34) synthetase TilS [Bacteroidales bacterium]
MQKTKVKELIMSYGVPKGTRLLCAVSGGIDSMVMLSLLNEMNYECVVAHCNFRLRGDESDGDEQFVREMCEKMYIPCFVNTFDTHKFADETGLSIQMAARKLRYDWFYELAEKENCSYIALAHNSDDQVETAILNFARGTGIRGVSGMKPLAGKLFRPLIEVSRADIVQISTEDNIPFHNDSTNATTKYARNKVRHLVIPLLEEINVAAKENILKSVSYFAETERIMNDYVRRAKEAAMSSSNGLLRIDVAKIMQTAAPSTVLFEMLIGEGVPKPLASESVCLLEAQTGRKCEMDGVEIVRNREYIEVQKSVGENDESVVTVNAIGELKKYGFEISFAYCDDDFVFDKNPQVAYIDVKKLKFPLTLRKWNFGDKFMPLGMKGMRKLSDFFKDEKLSQAEKSNVRILESDGKIVWVVGMRIDERFKFDKDTKEVYVLKNKQ